MVDAKQSYLIRSREISACGRLRGSGYRVGREWIVVVWKRSPRHRTEAKTRSREWDSGTNLLASCHLMI
jgi:hypothetical protein